MPPKPAPAAKTSVPAKAPAAAAAKAPAAPLSKARVGSSAKLVGAKAAVPAAAAAAGSLAKKAAPSASPSPAGLAAKKDAPEDPLLLEEREAAAAESRPKSAHCFDTEGALQEALGGGSKGGGKQEGVVDCEGTVLDRAKGIWIERSEEEQAVDGALKASEQGYTMILADSGSGKSTFMARVVQNWRRVPRAGDAGFDFVHAAFVGAVEGSTSVTRVLSDLCAALARDGGSGGDGEEAPTDLSGLGALLAELLSGLSDSGKRVLIALDALNELETGRGLTWLPKQVPKGIFFLLSCIDLDAGSAEGGKSVMASAAEGGSGGGSRDACEEVLGAVQRGWGGGMHVVKLKDMTSVQREDMLRQMVTAGMQGDGKGVSEVVTSRLPSILSATHGESPLYLRLAAEDVVRSLKGGSGAMMGGMPGSIPLVFGAMLKELDEGMGPAAGVTLQSVWCSQGGLLAPQLKQIVEEEVGGGGGDGGAATTKVWEGMWGGCLSSILRVGAGGLVGFTHMQARDAVSKHYFGAGAPKVRRAHRRLARYMSHAVRERAVALRESVPAVWCGHLRKLPEHLRLGGAWEGLRKVLCDVSFCLLKLEAGLSHSLVSDLTVALAAPPPSQPITRDLSDYLACLRGGGHVLAHVPWLLGQQAMNQRSESACVKAGEGLGRGGEDKVLFRWVNKPQTLDALTATFSGARGNLVWTAGLSADGKSIALGGSDCKVRVCESSSSEEVAMLAGHSYEIAYVLFDPSNASTVISVSSYSLRARLAEVFVWDVKEGGKVKDWQLDGGCFGLDWTKDGSLVAMGFGSDVKVYSVREDWKQVGKFEGSRGACLSLDGKKLAVGQSDHVIVHAIDGGKAALVLKGHKDEGEGAGSDVNSVAWGDNKTVASGSNDLTVRVWDTIKGSCIAILRGHHGMVSAVAMSPDAGTIVSASNDKTVKVWRMPKAGWSLKVPPGGGGAAATMRGHSDDVQSVTLERSKGRTAVSCSDDGTARIWDIERAQLAKDPPGHTNPSSPITAAVWCLRENAKVIVSSDSDGGVRCFKDDGQSCIWKIKLQSSDPENKQAVTSLCGNAKVDKVVCGMYQRLHVIETKQGKTVQTLEFPEWVNVCCVSERMSMLAVGGEESHVWVFGGGGDGAGWKRTVVMDREKVNCDVTGCSFDPQATMLATCGNDGSLSVWSMSDSSLINRLHLSAQVTWCEFGVSKVLAACLQSGSLVLVSVDSWQIVCEQSVDASLIGSRPSLSWCSFTDKGSHIITSSASKMIYTWHVTPSNTLSLVGMFPAFGSFGSPDGIGGQGCLLGERFVIGDRGGRLYLMNVEGI